VLYGIYRFAGIYLYRLRFFFDIQGGIPFYGFICFEFSGVERKMILDTERITLSAL
jgi:hypothetical protein